ncbi:transglutaminase domain-containing protein [Pseudoflavonifractor phocaeensis]|uniref:transglutaminase domain-containing protein n=1 Tax=Pseudoflavonifractor phocaeensis TaxID=1870988 RepID=UPI001957E4F7|nr:transglutaminase domain-containing protein [Pseudoflavonifractor phocaeensis]MBM6924736.1 S-layer homology domain-containing protein [Pseudoflavonifractor phocaeensis]
MKRRTLSALLTLFLLLSLLPAAAAQTGGYGLVISVDVWQTPAKLGVLMEGDQGIVWADYTGALERYAAGTIVRETQAGVVSPADPAPAGITVDCPGVQLNFPSDTIRIPAGLTLTFNSPVGFLDDGGNLEVAGHLVLNDHIQATALTVLPGGRLTVNAPLQGHYIPIFPGTTYSGRLELREGAVVDGSYLVGLVPQTGTYYYDMIDGWWYRELTPQEQEAARDPQLVIDRNSVALDSAAARLHYLAPVYRPLQDRPEDYAYDDPRIISTASEITAGLTGERDKALAIYQWVAENVWYDYDYYHYLLLKLFPGSYDDQWSMEELEQYAGGFTTSPVEILEGRHTICDGYTRLTCDLLRAAGIPARMVSNDQQPDHAWTEAYVDGAWLTMDTTFASQNLWEHGAKYTTGPCRMDYFDFAAGMDATHIPGLEGSYLPVAGCTVDSGLLTEGGLWGDAALPSTAAGVGPRALSGCAALERLVVPEGVTVIREQAFLNCTALEEVVLPQSLLELDLTAFEGCTALERVIVPEEVAVMEGAPPQGLTLVSASPYVEAYAKQWSIPFLPLSEPSAWAAGEVASALDAGLIPAALQGAYTSPAARGQVAALVVRLLERCSGREVEELLAELGAQVDRDAFTDTADPDALAANALGILKGGGGGRFDPAGSLTRSQMAAILTRTAEVLGVDTTGCAHSFTDMAGHWAEPEVGWPVQAGILNGVGGGRFDPEGVLTAEQAAVIAWRAFQALAP